MFDRYLNVYFIKVDLILDLSPFSLHIGAQTPTHPLSALLLAYGGRVLLAELDISIVYNENDEPYFFALSLEIWILIAIDELTEK